MSYEAAWNNRFRVKWPRVAHVFVRFPFRTMKSDMRLFRHTQDVPANTRGAVVALGNFDGVHRGHQAVIHTAGHLARDAGAPLAVLTFEPHPRGVFHPETPPFRLTPFRIKARQLEVLGVDVLFMLHFDAALRQKNAEDFVRHILVQDLHLRHAVAGHDFRFGHRRSGDMRYLAEQGARLGFGVSEVGPVHDPEGGIFSSTRIRDALRNRLPREAAHVLGHPWEIEGRIETGEQRGRTIGFPTANIELGEYLRPAFGVYAVRAGLDAGAATHWYEGVANLGQRPTVHGTVERLEVHLFDFSGNIYGRHMRVQLWDFLRPEQHFSSFAALAQQIKVDAEVARRFFAQEYLTIQSDERPI